MRSLLGGWSPAVVTAFVAVELLACPRIAAAQSKETATAKPQGAAMGPVVRTASNGEVALDLLFTGNCDGALAELSRAPDMGRPLPQAIRGLCAAKAGRRSEATMLRDSVLTHPLADPHSWPMIVARGVALKIR